MSRFYTSSTHKKNLYLLAFFYLLYFFCLLLFILKPTLFYYSAWEYFDEIGFHFPKKCIWKARETGNQGRSYIFSFQKHWPTLVSVDAEGYRTVPFIAEHFPVVIFGDSHTWGSGLSDHETIPWLVALQLQVPVFNGGRLPFTLSKMIQNPRLKEAKIIVELVAQHLVTKEIFSDDCFDKTDYEVYTKRQNGKNYYFAVHPKRFFLPLKILRNLNITKNVFNELTRHRVDDSIVNYKKKYSFALKETHLERALENICNRAEILKSKGYQYIIALVPSKELQLSYQPDSGDLAQEKKTAEELKARGVDYIDLCTLFRNSNARSLFIPTDSHINPKGAQLIAESLTNYIQNNYAELLEKGPLVSE